MGNWVRDAIIIRDANQGPSRGLLRDCTTSPINRFAALILTLPLFRPSQKCPETGCVLPAVGAGGRPRQREVRQERVHLPRHPDHPRPPRHDPGVRGKLIRAKIF